MQALTSAFGEEDGRRRSRLDACNDVVAVVCDEVALEALAGYQADRQRRRRENSHAHTASKGRPKPDTAE